VVLRGDGTVGGFQHQKVFGNVIPRAHDITTTRTRNYARRARPFLGAPENYDGGQIIKNSSNGICHICNRPYGKQDLVVDHVLPVRAYPFLSMTSKNMRLAHAYCNSSVKRDLMPNAADLKAASMEHLLPLHRVLNPLDVRFPASEAPVSESEGMKTVHLSVPGFRQHSQDEFDPQGRRHAAVERWLGGVEKLHGAIPNFHRNQEPVFVGAGRELNPKIKAHLTSRLPSEFRKHFSLLKGRVWLRRLLPRSA
jgi:hypothetical protein